MVELRTTHLGDLEAVQLLADPGVALDLLGVQLPLRQEPDLFNTGGKPPHLPSPGRGGEVGSSPLRISLTESTRPTPVPRPRGPLLMSLEAR